MNQIIHHLFIPKGRIGRLQYFLFGLILVAITRFIFELANNNAFMKDITIANHLFLVIVLIISSYSAVVLVIKRLHDLEYNGWASIFLFLPYLWLSVAPIIIPSDFILPSFLIFLIVSAVESFIFLFCKGTNGVNKYGQ